MKTDGSMKMIGAPVSKPVGIIPVRVVRPSLEFNTTQTANRPLVSNILTNDNIIGEKGKIKCIKEVCIEGAKLENNKQHNKPDVNTKKIYKEKNLKIFLRGALGGLFCSVVPIAQLRLADIPYLISVSAAAITCGVMNLIRYKKFDNETNRKNNRAFIKSGITLGTIVHLTLQTSIGESITLGICGGIIYSCLNHIKNQWKKKRKIIDEDKL